MLDRKREEHEFTVSIDHRQEIVEVVGDAAGELTGSLHFLGLAQLRLQTLALSDVGDDPANRVHLPFCVAQRELRNNAGVKFVLVAGDFLEFQRHAGAPYGFSLNSTPVQWRESAA